MSGPRSCKPKKFNTYVYRCEHKKSKRFYIGYREGNKVPPNEDLGVFYFTSSSIVSRNFKNYNYEVLSEYETGKAAYDVEQRLIYEFRNDPLLINGIRNNPNGLIPVDADVEAWEEKLRQKREKKLIRRQANRNPKVVIGIKLLLDIKRMKNTAKAEELRSKNKILLHLAEEYLRNKDIDIDSEDFTSVINSLEI